MRLRKSLALEFQIIFTARVTWITIVFVLIFSGSYLIDSRNHDMMILSSLPKVGLNIVTKRFIKKKINMKSWPNDWVPFHWTRPVPVPGYYETGDLVDFKDPDVEDLQEDVRMSTELRDLDPDDPLRKIFSLGHARRSRHNKTFVNDHLRQLGLFHEVDFKNSMEAKIVNLTFSLRHVQECVRTKGEDNRFNGHVRKLANSIAWRRWRYLCALKDQHYDRYKRIIDLLDIEDKDNPINVERLPPYRKIQMRKLALDYAQNLKEKKVEDFMKSIDDEKKNFEAYKVDTLKWIEKAEKELESLNPSH